MSVCLCVCLYLCLCAAGTASWLCLCLSCQVSTSVSVCLSVCLPICLSVCLSACVCPPVCLSACVCPPVCVSVSVCVLILLVACVCLVRSQLQCSTYAVGDVATQPWHSAKLCHGIIDCSRLLTLRYISSCTHTAAFCLVYVIVCRLTGNIIRTALCWIVWHSVYSPQHTYVSSSYRSNRLGLSHWDP